MPFNNSEIQKVLLLIVLVVVSVTYAIDPPSVQWLRTFPKGTRTLGSWVAQTGDGGYVAVGNYKPDDNSFDFYIVKTDSRGKLQWNKILGVGPKVKVNSGCLSKDGGFVIAGHKRDSSSLYYRALLVKTDSLGNTIWSKEFEDDTTNPDFFDAKSVQPTRDGGYVIAGYGGAPDTLPFGAYLIKIDSLGNEEWRRAFYHGYRWGYYTVGLSVQQTLDGGYIIGTIKDSVLRLIKTDTSGNTQWERTFYDKGGVWGYWVYQTRDGGYIATGIGHSSNPESDEGDVYLLKTDASGNFQWKKTYGGSVLDGGLWVTQTSDGGYLVAGCTTEPGAEHISESYLNGYLVRTDRAGNVIWEKQIGEPNHDDDAVCAQQTADGGYIITGSIGYSESNQGHIYLLKLAPESKKK